MPVKVYIWRKQKQNEIIGHASLSLSDGTHISWWPENAVGKSDVEKTLSCTARKGQTLEKDIEFEECNPLEYIIEMSTVDEKKIKDWWNEFKKTHKDYHLLKMNCSTVVFLALKEVYPNLKYLDVLPVWIPAAVELVARWLSSGVTIFDGSKIAELKSQSNDASAQYLMGLIQ